jgi:quercetin dioxygenase-like cupin family protein
LEDWDVMTAASVRPFVRALALTVGLAACAPAAPPASVAAPRLLPADHVDWAPAPAPAGAQQAVLWGDPQTGPSGILLRWPGGAVFPLHALTNDSRAFVQSGTLTVRYGGGEAVALGAGSFMSLPARLPHEATCLTGAACTFYVEHAGKFEFAH